MGSDVVANASSDDDVGLDRRQRRGKYILPTLPKNY